MPIDFRRTLPKQSGAPYLRRLTYPAGGGSVALHSKSANQVKSHASPPTGSTHVTARGSIKIKSRATPSPTTSLFARTASKLKGLLTLIIRANTVPTYIPSQSCLGQQGSASTVASFTFTSNAQPITTGSFLCVFATAVASAGSSFNWTLTDNASGGSNTYSAQSLNSQDGEGASWGAFICQSVSGNPTQFTLNAGSGTIAWVSILVDVFISVNTSVALSVATNTQANPGTGADAVTSTTLTPHASGVIWGGLGVSMSGTTFGTGESFGQYGPLFIGIGSEYKACGTSAIASTWTNSTNGGGAYFDTVAISLPAAGGLQALLARSLNLVKARPLVHGNTPLRLHSEAQLKAHASPLGSTHLTLRSSIQEKSRATPLGSTSLRSRTLNAIKSRLTSRGNVSLHSKSASQTKARAGLFVGLLIRANSSLKVKSHALAHGSAAVFARGVNQVKGHPLASGTTKLLARSSAQIKARAALHSGALLALLARSATMVKSRAVRVGTAAMAARSSNKVKSHILFSGTTHLLAHGVNQVKARAQLHSGAIFQLLAHSAMMVKSHVAAYKGTAAMLARSSIKVKSNASRTGVTALLARSAIKVKGRALVASGNFIQLLARSASQVKSRIRPPTGAAGLHSRSAARVAAQITFSGTTRLLARSSAKVKSRANPFVGLLLHTMSAIQAKGRPRALASTHLLARSSAQVKASAQASGRVVLRARSAVQAKSHSTFRKLVVLYARSSTKVKGLATPQGGVIQLLARAAFKIFGRAFIGGKIVFNPKFVATAQNIYYTATAQPLSWTSDDLYAIRDLTPSLAGTIEGETATFDFGPRIASSVTISAITSVSCVVKTGYDATPQSRLSGPPVIGNSPSTGIAGQAVAQNFVGGIGGCVYLVTCLVMCSDGIPRSIEVGISCYRPF